MPALEMAQETGKLVTWLKKEGEPVSKGEMLLEVETDKAVVEVEAAADGILAGITARPGDVVPVGQTIAWIVQPGEQVPGGPTSSQKSPRISPKARRLAEQRGIDISRVRGSGPDGEILADDVLSAPNEVRLKPDATTEGLSTAARLMAERTTQSWTTVPHFFVTREVDATALNAAREALLRSAEHSHDVNVTHTDLIVSAVARTLRRHERLNASWTASGIALNRDVNVAIALAVEDAVVTGVIRHADTAAVADIAARRGQLMERARAGKLQPEDISGATFTISNLGMFGVDGFTAIIVPPQAAVLAVAAIGDRVVAVGGKPAVRPMMTLTLSCDHRVVDGARAAGFLRDLVQDLSTPAAADV